MGEHVYGYIRVSSKDQNEDRQRIAMGEFGVQARNVYLDKQSGRDFLRPGYRRMVRRLRPGDTVVVQSIDRLGRNYEEILEQWRVITKDKQAAVVVLDMPLLDTRQGRDLTGVLIADIVLQLLSYVAQTERETILQRQAEGIAAARARGVHLGRPKKAMPQDFDDLCRRWRTGELTGAEVARRCGVTVRTLYRRLAAPPEPGENKGIPLQLP